MAKKKYNAALETSVIDRAIDSGGDVAQALAKLHAGMETYQEALPGIEAARKKREKAKGK